MEKKMRGGPAAGAGVIWFHWLVVYHRFAQLVWWKIILGIVVWPLFFRSGVR